MVSDYCAKQLILPWCCSVLS